MPCPSVPRRVLPLLLVLSGGCAGVSVRPDAAAAEDLPRRELTADEAAAVAGHTEAAIAAVVRRRYQEADEAAGKALAIDPRAARARAVRGMVLLQQANLDDPPDLFLANAGEAEVLRAERLAPDDAFVGWMRAVFLAEAGHLSAAADAAEAALARTAGAPPTERAALLGVAGTYRYELGEERRALPLLQDYVAIRSDDATANFRIGTCLLRIAELPQGANDPLLRAQRQAEEAAKAFARCAQLAPGDEDAALAVGAALLRAAELAAERGDTAGCDRFRTEANARFLAAATQFAGSPEPVFRLAVLAELRGESAVARDRYREALVREPRHLPSLINLAALRDAEPDGGPAAAAEVAELLGLVLAIDREQPGLTAAERRRIAARLAKPAGAAAVDR